MKNGVKIHLLVLILGILMLWCVVIYKHNKSDIPYSNIEIKQKEYSFILNKYNLLSLLKSKDVKFPDIATKQSILETGNFTSKVCLDKCNIFGFYNGEYLEFESYEKCVEYYKRWQDRKYKGGDYYLFLKNLPYAQDSTYIEKLKKIKL